MRLSEDMLRLIIDADKLFEKGNCGLFILAEI